MDSRHSGPGWARRGFTLIELLVVVAIIGLLISILLPGLKAARESTRSVKCLANLRTMGQAIATYSMDNRDTLPGPLHPPIYRNTGKPDDGTNTSPCFDILDETNANWFLLARLSPQLSNVADEVYELADEIGTCPTAKTQKGDDEFCKNVNGNPTWSRPYNYLPNSWANTVDPYYFGWVNLGYTWTGWQNAVNTNPAWKDRYPKKVEQIRRSSEEWAIGDAWADVKVVFVNPRVTERTPVGTWQLDIERANSSHNPLPKTPYHGSGTQKATNLLYFDGHGDSFQGVDNWALKFPINRPPDP